MYMDGANIRKWIDKVLSGESDWFKLLRLPLSRTHVKESEDLLSENLEVENDSHVDWEGFTRGWIHATASLKSNTPKGFREAFEDMESWALAYSEINDEFDGYDHPQHHPHASALGHEKTVDKIKAKGDRSFLPPFLISD